MIATYVVSLLLIGLSGVLLDMHRRSWREAQHDGSLTERDLRFARSQYKRRMQSSSIIGVLGAAIGVAPLVPHEPMAFALYLAAISAACMAIMLLAAIDAWATRQNFVRVRSEQLAAQIKLAREVTRRERSIP
jgi:hypothetical protein